MRERLKAYAARMAEDALRPEPAPVTDHRIAGPILPGATIGMVGGGQLGRMFAAGGAADGVPPRRPGPGEATRPPPSSATSHIRAPFEDLDACLELARRSDVVTLEWENADVATLRAMAERVQIHPSPDVLEVAQHRVREKDAARRLGVRTAEYRAVRSREELHAALEEIGAPAILKTARMGYDGKGQAVIRDAAEADAAWDALSRGGGRLHPGGAGAVPAWR